jgi:hypothetical protein
MGGFEVCEWSVAGWRKWSGKLGDVCDNNFNFLVTELRELRAKKRGVKSRSRLPALT